MFSAAALFSHHLCQMFISSVCIFVRVTVLDTNKDIVCSLLATPAIMLAERKKRKRKMWRK